MTVILSLNEYSNTGYAPRAVQPVTGIGIVVSPDMVTLLEPSFR
jgi:hypothetical protein